MLKIKILNEKQEEKINNYLKSISKNSDKYIKIKDNFFRIGLHKGLIEKSQGAYYLIGNYEKLLHFKIKK